MIFRNSRKNRLLTFVIFSYGLGWILIEGFFFLDGEGDTIFFTFVGLGYMSTPTIAALISNKTYGYSWCRNFGLKLNWSKWYIIAPLLPVAILIMTIIISSFFPNVMLTNGIDFIQEQLSQGLSEKEVEIAMGKIKQVSPTLLYTIIIVSGLFAGTFVNVFPALGEEIGWRGFLQEELSFMGLWKSSASVGIIWGLWHTPMILRGHNYPENPILGIILMVLITVLFSPIMYYLRKKSDSVIPVAIFHGVNNSIAALPLIVLSGGSRILTGMTGVAGILALAIINLFPFLRED